MTLLDRLRELAQGKTLYGVKLVVTFTDGEALRGLFRGYTDPDDVEPEEEQIDLELEDGRTIVIGEPEIRRIELA